MATDHTDLYETMPVHRAVPTVISQLITVIYNMADTFFIGQTGDPNQVAAATLCFPLFVFLTALANLFGIGGSAMISRCLGAGNRERAKHGAAFCVWTAAAITLLFGLLLLCLRGVILPLLGADSDTYTFACDYLLWTTTLGGIPTVVSAVLAHLIRAEGYSKQASLGIAFGGVLNMALDPLFIFGFGLQIQGAAMATMLSNLVAVLYFAGFLHQIREHSAIQPSFENFSLRDRIPSEVLTGGLPSFIMALMSTLSNASLNALIASHSNTAVAGIGIAKKIDSMAYYLAQGMTQGVLSLIGYNYASGNRKRMNQAIRTALLYCFGVSVGIMLFLFFTAGPLTAFFIDNAETVSYGKQFLKIIALACPTTALNFMIITIFQATKQRWQPMFLSFLRKGTLDIPLMLLFHHLFGIDGILWAAPIADALALLIAAALFLPYFRKLYPREGS